MTSARKRRNADVLRMGMAMSYPGIDPRTWVSIGRVDNDPQAFRWHPQLGWIVDVTMAGGPLDQESEVPCKTVGIGRGQLTGEFIPPSRDCEVLVALQGGDLEEGPVIVGSLSNTGGCEVPLEINGLPITPGTTEQASTPLSVSPFDTEIKKSPHNRREEYAGETFIQQTKRTIETTEPLDSLTLGSRTATQHVVLGENFISALIAQLQLVLVTYTDSLAVPIAPTPVATDAAYEAMSTALTATLSRKIKVE